MNSDYHDVFNLRGTAGAGPAGLCLSPRAGGDGQGRGPGAGASRTPDRRSRHRHGQDLCLPGSRAAVGAQRDHLHRHAHAAGSAVSPRCAAAGTRLGVAGENRPAQGPRQLSLPASARARDSAGLLLGGERGAARTLARISRWAATTKAGDLSELTDLPEQSSLWPQITSTRENCLGSECPQFSHCHVFEARRNAQAADIVVVNHHLLLADLALKDEGFGDLLPGAEAVILDEAHQVPDIAAQFFGQTWSVRQVQLLLRDITAEMMAAGVRDPAIVDGRHRRGEPARGTARRLAARAGAPRMGRACRMPFWMRCRNSRPASATSRRSSKASARAPASRIARGAPRRWPIRSPHCASCRTTRDCAGSMPAPVDCCCSTRPSRSPSGCGNTWSRAPAPGYSLPRLWPSARISRTLPRASACRKRARCTSTVRSTIAAQARIFLPPRMPQPQDAAFAAKFIDACAPLLEASGGRAFLLYTSYRGLAEGVRALQARFPESAVSGAGAGRGAARSAVEPVSRARQCGAAGHGQFLGRAWT